MLPLSLLFTAAAFAQYPGLTLPPSGNNQMATVVQHIGPVEVRIVYSSPAVHGPDGKDRRGQIWGKLVPYGLSDLGFGNGKPDPWRAGANQNTVFSVSDDVVVQGKPLPAGQYGLHMIPGQDEWTIIFSKDSGSWGSFFYDDSHDALRVQTKPVKHDYREWLTYDFVERKPTQSTVELQWEDLALPWTIQVPDVNKIYVTHLTQELTNQQGFDYHAYDMAAQFCIQSNSNLEQGLKWADAAVSMPGIGQANFSTLNVKAQVLSKMGRKEDADAVMKTALNMPGTTPLEIHTYGRQLIGEKRNAEALQVFQLNAQRNGDAWPTNVGLMRGYAATGDSAKALEYAKKALVQAPDALNKKNLETIVKDLSDGKPLAN
jgi:hypothetical protein